MNARRLILAAVVSLSSLTVGGLFAAPAALAEEPCPNVASRQGPSVALPDCRAYEEVTPVSKADATDMFPSSNQTEKGGFDDEFGYAAADGERFLLYTEASLAGGDSIQSGYVMSRGGVGWTTTSLSPGPGIFKVEPLLFDPENLSEVGLRLKDVFRVPGQEEKFVNSDTVLAPGGPPTTVFSGVELSIGEGEGKAPKAASADLSHLVLESTDYNEVPAPPGLDGGFPALDEWSEGHLQPIDVATNGSLVSPCGAVLGNGEYGVYGDANAISGDGSRIIFTAPDPDSIYADTCWKKASELNPPEAEEDPPQLYMRIGGTSTVEISAPNRGVSDPAGPQAAFYVGASVDDSKVFFMSRAQLTAGDPGHAPELYEYDTEAPEGERLVRVSSGESGSAEGKVDYVGAISSDGSAVYFSAYGKLAEGATSGSLNLYYYDTTTGKTTYISQAPSFPMISNNPDLTPNEAAWAAEIFKTTSFGTQGGAIIAPDAHANWATTPNGQYLVFTSTKPLTGYDNVGVYELNKDEGNLNTPDFSFEEVFRYSVAENSLVCVSCAVGAPPPIDNATFNRATLARAVPDIGPPQAISDDGGYVFFETENALVPQAIPGRLHVYEWHDGKISLISSSDDPSGAFFLGASADGSNVFFGTHAQLVPQDTDAGGDVYDARIDGGFVGLTPSQCTGTGCQGIPSAPPIFATPASVTFEGVGNFPAGTVAPTEQKTVKPKPKSAKAQKLARALKACKGDRVKHRRVRCEAGARARYSRASKSNKSTKAGRGS
jgi:hypothetical protein